jgi:hypothetical protein
MSAMRMPSSQFKLPEGGPPSTLGRTYSPEN